jgi:hypothetical protein
MYMASGFRKLVEPLYSSPYQAYCAHVWFDLNLTLESAFLGKEGLELNSVSGQKETDHTTKGKSKAQPSFLL